MKDYKVAVVGATGMVGQTMLKVLEERDFPVSELIAVASERSKGKTIIFKNKEYRVVTPDEAVEMVPDFAIFSAGGSTSLEWAPLFAEKGTVVIDNSSAWRMHENIPLVIPEINIDAIGSDDKIIANPNCSTIQLLMAIAPLHLEYGISRMVITTFQSVTGTGVKAYDQLINEVKGVEGEMAYPHKIFMNCLPHCDVFLDNAYTKEEMKLVNETRKIMSAPDIDVTATCVRVPVIGGHSESVNIEFKTEFELEKVLKLLNEFPGVKVTDDPANNIYPMPINSHGSDDVFVGRIRRDESRPKCLNLWVVSDNIRKGAATNAIQIAESLIRNQ